MPLFGDRNNRCDRLSSLKLCKSNEAVHGVHFANLKKFDYQATFSTSNSVTFLLGGQYPRLEEFCFNANVLSPFTSAGYKEAIYNVMFSRMASLKKLTITYQVIDANKSLSVAPHLPRASIRRLNCLETIVLNIEGDPGKLHDFVKPLEEYVDGISSLKKLTVDVSCLTKQWDEWVESLEEEVERLKLNQDRVKIDFLF